MKAAVLYLRCLILLSLSVRDRSSSRSSHVNHQLPIRRRLPFHTMQPNGIVPFKGCIVFECAMFVVGMMHEFSSEQSTFMHHADPLGLYQPLRFGMMHECSNSKLLVRVTSMHHVDRGHGALKQH